jgi:hypothetical protein
MPSRPTSIEAHVPIRTLSDLLPPGPRKAHGFGAATCCSGLDQIGLKRA